MTIRTVTVDTAALLASARGAAPPEPGGARTKGALVPP
jgi:hypothetical protein